MLIFMIPMVILYFIGIAVSAMVVRGKRKRAESEEAADKEKAAAAATGIPPQ